MEKNLKNSKICSKKRLKTEWANDLLRYGISVLKKWWVSPNSHSKSVVYKILIIAGFIGQLEREGFWWQSKILAAHLHRHLAGLQAPRKEPDTLSKMRETSSIEVGVVVDE